MPGRAAALLVLNNLDLLDAIFECPSLTSGDLGATAVVQRRWLSSARRVLYRCIETSLPDRCLSRTMDAAPELCLLVRELRLRVLTIAGERWESMAQSMHWMSSAKLRAVSVHCFGGLAGENFNRIVQSWDIPTLRTFIVEGYDFTVDIPQSVRSLTLTGFSPLGPHHMPDVLEHFRRVRDPFVPLDVLYKYASTLIRFDLEFDAALDMRLFDPPSESPSWGWPVMPRLEFLSLFAPEPLYLNLNTGALSVSTLRISVCLLEWNRVPYSVLELQVISPGRFTVEHALRLIEPPADALALARTDASRLRRVQVETDFDAAIVPTLAVRGLIVLTSS